MSHYTTIQTKITDLESLTYAVESLGFKYEVGRQLPLYNWTGSKTQHTADLVIPRKYLTSISNDIGFSKQRDGTYKIIISDIDQNDEKTKHLAEQLRQRYAYYKVKKELKLDNKEVLEEKIDSAGNIQIIVEA